MADEIGENINRQREGRVSLVALELIGEILDDLDRSVDKRILGGINSGEKISQEDSAVAWGEKNAYSKLRKRLTQKVSIGESAGKKLEPYMNPEDRGN